MTAVVTPVVEAQADSEGISQPRAVVVGIMAGEGVQIGVLLDANAPVSVMTDPLLKVVNSRLRELGETTLEATGRTIAADETEREIAGQIAHRLTRHGALPVHISVAADGRSRVYRQPAYTAVPIKQFCVMSVTARKYGLCARASRSISFGQPDAQFRKEHDAACKVSATYVASSWPDSVPQAILASGQRIYQLVGGETEFYACPQGHIIGRTPVELQFTPHVEELLQNNWAVCWNVSVGAALSCDTFLITEEGPRAITAADNWPLKRIRIQGADFVRPDLLVR